MNRALGTVWVYIWEQSLIPLQTVQFTISMRWTAHFSVCINISNVQWNRMASWATQHSQLLGGGGLFLHTGVFIASRNFPRRLSCRWLKACREKDIYLYVYILKIYIYIYTSFLFASGLTACIAVELTDPGKSCWQPHGLQHKQTSFRKDSFFLTCVAAGEGDPTEKWNVLVRT